MPPEPTATRSSIVSARTCVPTIEEHAHWFNHEVHAHDAQLRSYLRGVYPSVRDVDDVVQESYLRVWKRQLARPIASAKSFLFTVARHLALDTIRRQNTSPIDNSGLSSALVASGEKPVGAEALSHEEEIVLLAAAIATLPPRAREIVMLRKFDGRPTREIAARFAISEKTVEIHVTRGVKRLGEYLRAHGVSGRFDR